MFRFIVVRWGLFLSFWLRLFFLCLLGLFVFAVLAFSSLFSVSFFWLVSFSFCRSRLFACTLNLVFMRRWAGRFTIWFFVLRLTFDNGISRQRTKHIHKMLALGGVKIYELVWFYRKNSNDLQGSPSLVTPGRQTHSRRNRKPEPIPEGSRIRESSPGGLWKRESSPGNQRTPE